MDRCRIVRWRAPVFSFFFKEWEEPVPRGKKMTKVLLINQDTGLWRRNQRCQILHGKLQPYHLKILLGMNKGKLDSRGVLPLVLQHGIAREIALLHEQ